MSGQCEKLGLRHTGNVGTVITADKLDP
jgi:hypothetical protein